MINRQPPSTNAEAASPPFPAIVSRRAVLQMAGGAASLATIPTVAAQPAPPPGQTGNALERVRLVVNGDARELELDPRQSLLDVLRETLDLTGTKKGCNQGACGACTVLLNGRRVVSCLTLAAMHDGAEITTIEGLSRGEELHPLQAAFIEHDGLQCGYCTPGQIMSGVGCIAEGHAGSPEEIQFWMSGNICRCGAYPGIVAAVADAAERS
ncbi:(2Fe-2S)-binding protein [Sinorhizobium sp. CCBAU 05631]|uniref:(2Fe-2S)-binding protein n=1 Tax=Sinorhizobium sp. CCBAU 05631 TaxID=794846 RepID=UPI0004B7A77D|nr:(2Fe-2S)-binding protein [Sinorhizobium sp. CCBAU 05631]ASY55906.1 Periplasmic aromatic aldehyde oxidoreductase, iron-sulfur subunit YagT [Sinorhizobium sp. CCBAU 05631]